MNIESIIIRCLSENISLSLNEDQGIDIHAEQDIPDDLLMLLKNNKSGLIRFLQEQATEGIAGMALAGVSSAITPARRPRGEWAAPLSYAQQRLWLIDQIENGSSQYNLSTALLMRGILDIPALEKALQAIIERHEILRTIYQVSAGEQVMQVVKAAAPFKLATIDLSFQESTRQDTKLDQLIQEEAAATFDLSKDIMLRGALVKQADDCHVLILTVHHIAVDGWSRHILCDEIFSLYGSYKQQQPVKLAPLSIQYSDYAIWQRHSHQEDQQDINLQYWRKQLADAPTILSLPTDFPRPDTLSYAGAVVKKILPGELAASLNKLALENGCTLFMVLHAALACLLSRYANQTDIVIGTPVANRDHPQLAPLIGFFVNSLVLRSDLSGNPSTRQLLQQHKLTLLDAFEHQQTPFEYLVQALDVERHLNKSPIFQVMLALQNNSEAIPQLDGVAISSIDMAYTTAKFDLTLDVTENKTGLHLSWEYATDLFVHSSIEKMAEDYEILLRAMLENPQRSLDEITVTPIDRTNKYIELSGNEYEKPLRYWKNQLAGLPHAHSLPLDYVRTRSQSASIRSISTPLELNVSEKLNHFCSTQSIDVLAGLHAAVSVLLSRYSNERDIVVGIPLDQQGTSSLNRLVLRSDLSDKPSFSQLATRSQQQLADALANRQLPVEYLLEQVKPGENTGHHPLFQILLAMSNANSTAQTPGMNLPVQDIDFYTPYDLSIHAHHQDDGLLLRWFFNETLFDPGTIERMAVHCNTLLATLLNQPDINVFRAAMLNKRDADELYNRWNDTTAEYPADQCIHHVFESQVQSNPDAIALVYEQTILTYAELNQQANQLAHYLISEKHINPNTLVGVCIERSPDMLVAILGILKAGGAYVPLDPEYPQARVAYMLEDANLTVVITQSRLLEHTPVSYDQAICLDEPAIQQQLHARPTSNPERQAGTVTPADLAYVIYTSGSTGNPKGVMVEHTNVVNFLCGMRVKPGINHSDCLLAVTSTSFDIHGLELFLPLMVGARIVIASRSATYDPHQLIELIHLHAVSVMQATPATWKMLIDAHWQPVQSLKVLCGGEALSQSLAAALLSRPSIELWNMYGPTETTIWSCVEHIQNPGEKILMGKPIINTCVYLVDDEMNPVPVGVAGELLIGGTGVARGYLHRPELTAEKFIENPFVNSAPGSSSPRLYRTGDLVRWLPNGKLEFLGRIDHQVKIRGFRIELGEIENILLSHEKVKDSVVIAKDTPTGEKHLVAYVVIKDQRHRKATLESQHLIIDELRQHAANKLPEYMVPGVFVFLQDMPLTPNGKIDRKALPEPQAVIRAYIPPRSDMERQFCAIWEDVLSVKKVGIKDNFFQLGGHSMLAALAITKMRTAVNQELPLRLLFEAPTIESITHVINGKPELASTHTGEESSHAQTEKWESVDTHLSLLKSCTPSTKNVLFVPGAGNSFYIYDGIARKLIRQGINVFALHHDGVDIESELVCSISDMVNTYFPQIMKHCASDLTIAGYCLGGVIGYELAILLHQQGKIPTGLFFIDTTFMSLEGVDYQVRTEVPLSFDDNFLYGFFIHICAVYSKETDTLSIEDFLGMSEPECLERTLTAMQLSSREERNLWTKIIRERYLAEKSHALAMRDYTPNRELSTLPNFNMAKGVCPLAVLRSAEVRDVDEKNYSGSVEEIQREALHGFGFRQIYFVDLSGKHVGLLTENEDPIAQAIHHHTTHNAMVIS